MIRVDEMSTALVRVFNSNFWNYIAFESDREYTCPRKIDYPMITVCQCQESYELMVE